MWDTSQCCHVGVETVILLQTLVLSQCFYEQMFKETRTSCIGYLVYIDGVVGMVTFVRMRKSVLLRMRKNVNSSLDGFSTILARITPFSNSFR